MWKWVLVLDYFEKTQHMSTSITAAHLMDFIVSENHLQMIPKFILVVAYSSLTVHTVMFSISSLMIFHAVEKDELQQT